MREDEISLEEKVERVTCRLKVQERAHGQMLQNQQGKYVYAYVPFTEEEKDSWNSPQQISVHIWDKKMRGVQERMTVAGDLVGEYGKWPLCNATKTIINQQQQGKEE